MTDAIITAFQAIDQYANDLKHLLQKTVIEYESQHPGWVFSKLDCKIDTDGGYHFTPVYEKIKSS